MARSQNTRSTRSTSCLRPPGWCSWRPPSAAPRCWTQTQLRPWRPWPGTGCGCCKPGGPCWQCSACSRSWPPWPVWSRGLDEGRCHLHNLKYGDVLRQSEADNAGDVDDGPADHHLFGVRQPLLQYWRTIPANKTGHSAMLSKKQNLNKMLLIFSIWISLLSYYLNWLSSLSLTKVIMCDNRTSVAFCLPNQTASLAELRTCFT